MPLPTREAVHLRENLIERLLLLARSADRELPARAADRVQLVDEDDGRRVLTRLLEQITHARCADADDHLDELRAAHREEWHAGLSGDGAREKRLPCAGRANEQHTLRRSPAEPCVLLRIAEEVDDLDELVLRLVDAGDVVEGHLVLGLPDRSGVPCSRPRPPPIIPPSPPPCFAARRKIQT